jgi:ferritin-like metal-binding protein YciE
LIEESIMIESLQDVIADQIKDLYSAENQLVKALPRMAKAASTESLREAIEAHLEETKGHVDRLEQIADVLEIKPGGKKCKGMEGLIAEGTEALEEGKKGAPLDSMIIAAAQKVEHYEIAAYGTAHALAERLGESRIVELLQETLDEEGAADKKLTEISQDEVLAAAATEGDDDNES